MIAVVKLGFFMCLLGLPQDTLATVQVQGYNTSYTLFAYKNKILDTKIVSVSLKEQMCTVAQLLSVLSSVLEVPSLILSDSKVYSNFSLICVAVAVNTRKMEQ